MHIPLAIPEFEHINRYWDRGRMSPAAKILPGEYYVTRNEELITTVLGSCVSACIRDAESGIGGMNHFMLPLLGLRGSQSSPASPVFETRYGNHAMDRLIADVVRAGALRQNLEAKVFGGGRVLSQMTDVGRKNMEFVTQYLEQHRIPVRGSDLGDIYPRKVVYFPRTGAAYVRKLKTMHNDTIIRREEEYMHELEESPALRRAAGA